jgi:hypothetical protein
LAGSEIGICQPRRSVWVRKRQIKNAEVSVRDGLHVVYEALKKTGGKANGDALIAAMKGMAWESPRGPISIDPETRETVQESTFAGSNG